MKGKQANNPEKIQNNDSKEKQKPCRQNGEMQESINKGQEELKNKFTETNTITEIKNTLEGINTRISEAEE